MTAATRAGAGPAAAPPAPGRLTGFLGQLADAWAETIPELERDTLVVFGLLDAITRTWERAQGEVLGRFGLNYAEFLTLGNLRMSPPGTLRSPTELGRFVRQTSAGMSRVLGKLEAAGYVRRQPHPDDRRSSVMLITPKGRRLVDRAFTALHARQVELLVMLDGDDRAALTVDLERFHATLTRGRD